MTITVDNPTEAIGFADTPSIDAFSRLRVSAPFGIWDDKRLFNLGLGHWQQVLAVNGSITYLPDESSVSLAVTTTSGDRAVRQTLEYFAYVPGKSQFIKITGVIGAGQANTNKYVGYGDDLNGLFFKQQGLDMGVVVRTDTSGSAVDTFIAQADWNLDTLDGTKGESNPSGITFDPTQTQIFMLDFQWLGVGRIRYGVDVGGKIYYCHEINNANNTTKVYMRTPTLPIRYEIINTGTAAAGATLKEICNSVESEGGYALPGLEYGKGNDVTLRSVTTRIPIFAVRLLDSFEGKQNRRSSKIQTISLYAADQDVFFELAHVHTPATVTGTWTPVGNGSASEFSTDVSVVTATPIHTIKPFYVPAGKQATGSEESDVTFINQHSFLHQNFASDDSQIFVVYATSITGVAADVAAALTWMEFE